jgi:hypothetical protein
MIVMSMWWDLRLRTAATNGPIVHPADDTWVWTAMVVVVMMPAGGNSTRPPELSGNPTSIDIWERVGGMDEGVRILGIQYLR